MTNSTTTYRAILSAREDLRHVLATTTHGSDVYEAARRALKNLDALIGPLAGLAEGVTS